MNWGITKKTFAAGYKFDGPDAFSVSVRFRCPKLGQCYAALIDLAQVCRPQNQNNDLKSHYFIAIKILISAALMKF